MVHDDGLAEKPSPCVVCVCFLAFFASDIFEEGLEALHLSVEEIFILRGSVDDEKNLFKMMVKRGRISFILKVLRLDVECANLMCVHFRIAREFYVGCADAWEERIALVDDEGSLV